ncbi:MAG: arginine decarboxylase, pyruvoyl-dependent [Bacteroidetes bacterium]|nr:arginine decarboxylase, pyruvoyl-dependent [Bacteroidota bacterium]
MYRQSRQAPIHQNCAYLTHFSFYLFSGGQTLFVPKRIFFTKGVGRHKDYLQSFELALRDADLEQQNLVTVSSIFPPNCKTISKNVGAKVLQPGQITFVVMARNATNEANRLIASSIGVALPNDGASYGYLSEHHPFGETQKVAGEYAEDLAATMLATTLGVDFDPDSAWDEREQVYKASGKIFKSFNITQSAEGRLGLWTTVVSCAVLLPE